MAALNSQTHTYTRTRLRFLCLQVCFLIWSGCTDQIKSLLFLFPSCTRESWILKWHPRIIRQERDGNRRLWPSGVICWLSRGDELPPHSAGYMLQEKRKGEKNSWPSGTCQSNYPSHVNKSKPRGTAVEPSNTNTQTEFTWIPGFSRS